VYHYDPDRDIYYAYQTESALSQWAWIVVTVVLATVALCLEYGPSFMHT
jgi:hypothetical protein